MYSTLTNNRSNTINSRTTSSKGIASGARARTTAITLPTKEPIENKKDTSAVAAPKTAQALLSTKSKILVTKEATKEANTATPSPPFTTIAVTSTNMGRKYYASKKKRNNLNRHATTSTNGTNTNGNKKNNENYDGMIVNPQSYDLWNNNSSAIQNDVIKYFNQYRQGCYQYYNHIMQMELKQEQYKMKKSKTTSTAASTFTIEDSDHNKNIHIIGGIEFPSLCVSTSNGEGNDPQVVSVFAQPYLLLPVTLSAKQRKVIHQSCLQLDIFHDSVTDTSTDSNNRVMVVSCYVDGFQYLPNHYQVDNGNDNSNHKVLDLHLYKPWYFRRNGLFCTTSVLTSGNDSVVVVPESPSHNGKETIIVPVDPEAMTPTKSNSLSDSSHSDNSSLVQLSEEKVNYTKQMTDKIWQLIDQPGLCIRNNELDTISYNKLHNTTLENYPNMIHIKTTPYVLVDTPYKMQQCVTDLLHTDITEIAFDLEAYTVPRSTSQITCLIQITSNMKKEYIIDVLAPGVWDHIYELQPIFSNPKIVKIGHAMASLDVPSLYRDFGIVIVNAFDTYEAAKCIPSVSPYGLASLCQYYFMPNCQDYMSLKDTYQACNWRTRPLTAEMMLYARMDIHYLIPLRQLLIRDMILSYNPMIWSTTTITKSNGTKPIPIVVLDDDDDDDNNDDEVVVVVADKSATRTDAKVDKLDNDDHTASSIGEDPFLSEVHYMKLIPGSAVTDSNGISTEGNFTKNRDVLDFISKISHEEDGIAMALSNTTTTYDDNFEDDDDDYSFNTAIQSVRASATTPTNGTNGSSSVGSLNYNSDVYNTCTEEENEDDAGDDNVQHQLPSDVSADELRLQPIVMQCLTICQERCLNLWKPKPENHLKNDSYISIVNMKKASTSTVTASPPITVSTSKPNGKKKKSKKEFITPSLPVLSEVTYVDTEKDTFTKLYSALVEWRDQVAYNDMECLPGFVVSLDFLVNVAYKRPMSDGQLKIIAHQLPIILQQSESIRNSLYDVVIRQTMVFDQLTIPTATIYYYSNIKDSIGKYSITITKSSQRKRSMTAALFSTLLFTEKSLQDETIVKLLVGGSIGMGFIMSCYNIIKNDPLYTPIVVRYVQQIVYPKALLFINQLQQSIYPKYVMSKALKN